MKKLLLSFIILLIFTGCNKEKNEVKPNPALGFLKETWKVKRDESEFFNSANIKEHGFLLLGEPTYAISENEIVITAFHGGISTTPYKISEKDGKMFIEITRHIFQENYEITSISEKNMVWRLEKLDYVYYVGTDYRRAAKHVRTIQFER